ncbi:hypothetical protein [Asaia astilbis]|uniref:hypothetical protein n=1 Tax=Asaia astilbis TaxID=610244 RepID=UPI000472C36B|nr:hypothetical protein [Asaia astilbis]
MSWRPSARIVRPGGCATAQLRGMAMHPLLAWPDSNINGGADYSVDFSGLLGPGESVKAFAFDAGSAATLHWTYLSGTTVTAWFRWVQSGATAVTVCVLGSSGATYQAVVSIVVSATPALIAASPPSAPGVDVSAVNDATMSVWFDSLPNSPDPNRRWWNNAKIPTRLDTTT